MSSKAQALLCTPHPALVHCKRRGPNISRASCLQPEGPQNQKIHWGIVLLGKIMILQAVGHQISCLGVCYANDPQKGGYTTPAPALDLTTSLQGDYFVWCNPRTPPPPNTHVHSETIPQTMHQQAQHTARDRYGISNKRLKCNWSGSREYDDVAINVGHVMYLWPKHF